MFKGVISIIKKLFLYSRIIRKMTPGQIAGRVRRTFKYRFVYKISGMKKYKLSHDVSMDSLKISRVPFYFTEENDLHNLLTDVNLYNEKEAQLILNNEFCFLNKKFSWERVTDWNPKEVDDPLWKYYLNYFDYSIILLKAYVFTNNQNFLFKLKELINSWIDNTKPGAAVSWDPYPTSIRIVNWLVVLNKLVSMNHEDGKFLKRLTDSIVNQTNFLYNNLEYDLNNNHLTSNAKSLVWAGVLLDGAKDSKKWLLKGLKVLNKRFDEEISDDGFQYEASTSYQILSILDYIETYLLLAINGMDDKINIDKKSLETMVSALGAVLYNDGCMPLLNDSVLGYPIKANELMAACAVFFKRPDFKFFSGGASLEYLLWLFGINGLDTYKKLESKPPLNTSTALYNAGYFIMRSGFEKDDTCIIFDCGPIGPKHCPGHGHSDALSFELFAFGKQLIVDPGVYSYNSSKYRYFFKSTANHNTIVIDGKDQSELIGSFRVGKTAKTELENWESKAEYDIVEGLHKGYKGVTHKRKIEFYKPYDIIISDSLEGKGSHNAEAVFIFSEYLSDINMVNQQNCICTFGDIVLNISFETEKNGKVSISDSYISREWNMLTPVKKLTFSINADFPVGLVTKINISNEKCV